MQESARRIRKLPSHVIDMIKAGEIIERPASVVKELFENAVDAGATDVHVELLDGGRALVRVTDNGSGIPPEDVPLALERHATSKLETPEDLLEMGTFGFRGEALASIAAVGRFSLRSRVATEDLAAEIEVDEGKASRPKRLAAPVGTSVALKDLFSSVPARQKFLKSTATEFSHVQDYLLAMALAYPRVGVRLSHNGREVFRYAAAPDLKGRFEAMQRELSKEFVPFRYERGRFAVEGFAGLPETARPVPRLFLTFVNGRLVRDKVVRSGVLQAYSGLVLKGLLPSALVFVTVDPSSVDVNAHPAKTEIRFQDPLVIEDLVTIGIQSALKAHVTKRMLGAGYAGDAGDSGDARGGRGPHGEHGSRGAGEASRDSSERDLDSARRAGWGSGDAPKGTAGFGGSQAGGAGRGTGVGPTGGTAAGHAGGHSTARDHGKETGRGYATLSSLSTHARNGAEPPRAASHGPQSHQHRPPGSQGSQGPWESRGVGLPADPSFQGAASMPPEEGADEHAADALPPDLFAPNVASATATNAGGGTAGGGVGADSHPRPKGPGRPSALADARYLGQFRNCFLLFESGPDLLVVDQHALHERILYEELTRAADAATGIPRQEMLTPVLVPGPRTVALLVAESEEAFRKLGFRVEAMDEGTLALHAFPAFLPVSRATEVFEEVLARVVALSDLPEAEVHPLLLRARGARAEFASLGIHERNLEARSVYHMLHATMACHAAVRAGDPLGDELVRRLVARSSDVDFFAHCPHGRPVYRRFTEKDVGEWFLRI